MTMAVQDLMDQMAAKVSEAADDTRIVALLESQQALMEALQTQTDTLLAIVERLVPLVSSTLHALQTQTRVQVIEPDMPEVIVNVPPADVRVTPAPPRTRTITPYRDENGRIDRLTVEES